MRDSTGLNIVLHQQQPQSQMPSQAYINYVFISELSQELSLPVIYMSFVGVYCGVCFLLSGSYVAGMFTNGDSNIWVFIIATLQSIPLVEMSACGDSPWYTP